MAVTSIIAFDKFPFKAAYMHGFVQDSQGRKMSKSLGNYILPQEVIEKYGADVFRYYTIGGTEPGLDLNYNFRDMEAKQRSIIILWNLHKLLIQQYQLIKKNPEKLNVKLDVEERYILSRLNSTIKLVSEYFDDYKLSNVPQVIDTLLFDVSRTYVQLVREKAVGGENERKIVLYALHKVMMNLLVLYAPIMPYISEKIYQEIKRVLKLKMESVHLLPWPNFESRGIDKTLEDNMETIKGIIQDILYEREKAHLGIRWPLKEVTILTRDENISEAVNNLKEVIRKLVNVKNVVLDDYKDIRGYEVVLNTMLTKELEEEGFAREVIRRVQALRKKNKLVKRDKIRLYLKSEYSLDNWKGEIINRVGAVKILNEKGGNYTAKERIKGKEFLIGFDKM